MFKVTVCVMPKKGLHDPAGSAVLRAIQDCKVDVFNTCTVGKCIELYSNETDEDALLQQAQALAHSVLSNSTIEEVTNVQITRVENTTVYTAHLAHTPGAS